MLKYSDLTDEEKCTPYHQDLVEFNEMMATEYNMAEEEIPADVILSLGIKLVRARRELAELRAEIEQAQMIARENNERY